MACRNNTTTSNSKLSLELQIISLMKHNYILTVAMLLGLTVNAHAGLFIPNEFETYNTEDLRKISFDDDSIVAEWTDGQTKTYEFSSLQRILFNESGTQTEVETQMAEKGAELLLYPNPVAETLYLSGVPADTEVLMYASNGVTIGLLQHNGTTFEANVSNLKNGVYFLKIADKVVKFIKK